MKKIIFSLLMMTSFTFSFSQGLVWSKQFTGTGQNQPTLIATDNSGNVYVAGNFNGSITHDTYNFTSRGLQDVFIAKYSSSGVIQWIKQVGGPGTESIYGLALSPDQKNVYIGVTYNGTTQIESTYLTSEGSNDIFIAKYTSVGDLVDTYNAASGAFNQANGYLSVDASGNIIMIGIFNTDVSLGNGGVKLYANGVDRQNFIAKFDANGNVLWGHLLESTSLLTYVRTVTTVGTDIYISGQFSGSLILPNNTISSSNTLRDGFVAKLDANGNDYWCRRVMGSGNDIYVYRHNTDENGNVYLAGYFLCSQLTIDSTKTISSNLHPSNASSGTSDMLMLKYNTSGTLQWVKKFGSSGNDKINNISIASGIFEAVGSFSGSVTINGINLTSKGGSDACMIIGNATSGDITSVFTAQGKLNEDAWVSNVSPSGRNYLFSGEFYSDTLFLNTTTFKNPNTLTRDGFLAKYGCFDNISFTATQPSCLSSNDGSITANPSTGNSPYTYLWSNSATTQTISNLTAGTYSVTVSGTTGCTLVSSYNLTSNYSALQATYTKIDPCNGGVDGSITAIPSYGKTPYTYLWSNSKTTQTITALPAGTYYCTVSDACTSHVILTVTLSSIALSVTTSTTPTNPCVATGTATANPAGGKIPYTYKWSTSGNPTTQTITNLAVGTYTVSVKDGCNNQVSRSATVAKNTMLITPSSVCTPTGQCHGTATASVTGGDSPYTYLWSDASHQTTQTAVNLCYGLYTVTVKDSYNCSKTYPNIKVSNCAKSVESEISETDISVFPNPATDYVHVFINTPENKYTSIVIYNYSGECLYKKELQSSDNEINIHINEWASGVYFIRLNNDIEINTKSFIIKR
jgi:hypothetical protein